MGTLAPGEGTEGSGGIKLTASLPEGPPHRWMIKLFSEKLPYETPVKAMRFSLRTEEHGLTLVPRIRDRSGECFYGPEITVDWEGWRQVAWDLDETPPTSISQGDRNKLQDGPPMEIVVDFYTDTRPGGRTVTLYLDDLQVELSPRRD